jgi:hypothetical protein
MTGAPAAGQEKGYHDRLPAARMTPMESQDSGRLRSTLEHLASQGADVARIAALTIGSWREVEAALVPIVGQRGLAALYERSLHLSRIHHPWLAAVPEWTEPRMDLESLNTVLLQQESAAAAAGGGAHLQALYELLGSLIGLPLTERILSSIWSAPLSGSAALDLPND